MAWTWTNSNALKTVITVAWADEVKNGVKQLAADLYINPTNGGDGAADLAYPLEKLMPLVDGVDTSAGSTGVAITLPGGLGFTSVDDYIVEQPTWQEDPGESQGELIVTDKTTTGFKIKNTGTGTGKKFGYRAFRKVTS